MSKSKYDEPLANEEPRHNRPDIHPALRKDLASVLSPDFDQNSTISTTLPDGQPLNSLMDIIERNKNAHPNKVCYNWLDKTGYIVESYTYEQVWTKIESIAWHIRNKWNVQKGEMVLLCFPPCLDFIFAHFGCLLSGAVAVPVYPPEFSGPRAKKGVEKLKLITDDCNAKLCLTTRTYLNLYKVASYNPLSDLKWPKALTWRSSSDLRVKSYSIRDVLPNDLAFLQYTSGSTGNPKGVMIRHGNYLHNVVVLSAYLFPRGQETKLFTWTPLYHDMGLIANYTAVPVMGCTQYCMSPLTFLADPPLWVVCISRYRCNATGAPNFAYALAARKWNPERANKEAIEFDLSNLEFMGSGAEPVRLDTCQQFIDTFQDYGLNPGVIMGCYGMAESCVFVANGTRLRQITNKADGKPRVCCGNVDNMKRFADIDIRIIDPDTGKEVPDGKVGEVAVASKSVAGGYFGQPEKSEETFRFKIVGDNSGRFFLRTGDLGLIDKPDFEWNLNNQFDIKGLKKPELDRKELDERHLIITGREKDLIIVRGKNFYPQEIELAAETAMDPEKILREGCSVAFSVDKDETEAVVVVIEIRDGGMKNYVKSKAGIPAQDVYRSVCNTIAQKISVAEGVLPSTIVLIDEKSIPKTTSGKVQRRKTKGFFLENNLKVFYRWENERAAREAAVKDEEELPDNRNIPAVAVEGEETDEDADESLKVEPVVRVSRQNASSVRFTIAQLASVKESAEEDEEEEKEAEEQPDGMGGRLSDTFHSAVSDHAHIVQSSSLNKKGGLRSSQKMSGLRSSQRMSTAGKARASLRASSRKDPSKPRQRHADSLQVQILDMLQKHVPDADMGEFKQTSAFDELGIDSIRAVEFSTMLREELGIDLSPTVLYAHPTVEALTKHILEEIARARSGSAIKSMKAFQNLIGNRGSTSVAIVGVGLRLPGNVSDLRSFWAMMEQGVDLVKLGQEAKRDPDQSGAFISRDFIENFDPKFFGISEMEARAMDPSQRLLLTTAWEALHMGGVENALSLNGQKVGVFVGMSGSEHQVPDGIPPALCATSVHAAIASNRISYTLGLTGPSITFDTACSSSLVAMVQALVAIRAGACSSAIVGGINLMHDSHSTKILAQSGFLSPTERCHTWDASANGYVRAEGCVSMYMMPLSEAKRQELPVLAILEGGAVGSDGKTLSLTAPNPVMQAQVIKDAIQDADIHPSSVQLIEAHGTGTSLGDPIEIDGLQGSYLRNGRRPPEDRPNEKVDPLVVSSAKGNVGHLEAAAGVVGVTKAIMSLIHRQASPNIQLKTVNPKLRTTNLELPTELFELPDQGDVEVARAGVSSFGFGGTLAHVIVSDKDVNPPPFLEDGCVRPVFLFSGQGGIEFHGGWVAELYATTEVFKAQIDKIAGMMNGSLYPYSLQTLLGLPDSHEESEAVVDESALKKFAQPCVFAIQYALVAEWKNRGVEPSYVMGHSLGEIGAACAAGVMDLEVAVPFVLERSRAFNSCQEGVMVAVITDSKETTSQVLEYVSTVDIGVTVSAHNGPRQVVVAGTIAATDEFIERMESKFPEPQARLKKLKTSGAFHSPLMQPAADSLRKYLQSKVAPGAFQPAGKHRVKMLSTLTGRVETDKFADPEYWCNQIVKPVEFMHTVEKLSTDEEQLVYLEIGPGSTASSMFRHAVTNPADFELFTSVPTTDDGVPEEHLRLVTARLKGWTDPFDRFQWTFKRFELEDYKSKNRGSGNKRASVKNIAAIPTGVEEFVRNLVSGLARGCEFSDNTPFMNMGIDSMSLTSMAGVIQNEFQREVKVSDLISHSTVRDLTDWLVATSGSEGNGLIGKPSGDTQGVPSSCQAQMYSHMQKFDADSNMYNLPFAWELEGPFSPKIFEKTVRHLMVEHEAFRTGLRTEKGKIIQVARPMEAYKTSDWLEVINTDESVDKLLVELENKLLAPFDYENGPLFRVVIYVLGQDSHIVSMGFHHLAVDGGSLVLIMKQLERDYNILEETGSLTKRSILQPIDFAIYENKKLSTEGMLRPGLDFWVPMAKQSITNPTRWPTRPGAVEGGSLGLRGMYDIAFVPTLLQHVQDFVQSYNQNHSTKITPYVVFLTTLQIALYQWSHSAVVSIGSLFVNRDPGWLETIGPLFNTVPFSFDIGALQNENFIRAVEHIAPIVQESRDHQWMPQSAVLNELRRQGQKIPREGLYQISFVYQNFARALSIKFGTAKVKRAERWLYSDIMMAEFPLVIELDAATTTFGETIGEPMLAGFAYSKTRFEESSIKKLGDLWVSVVETLFSGDTVNEAPIRSTVTVPPEDFALIRSCNQTAKPVLTPTPHKNTVLYMIWEIANREPQRLAIRHLNATLTYGDLWNRVRELSGVLREKYRVTRGSVVAICVDRSFELVIGMMAIQLAGGAYCPIHPNEGSGRVGSILELAGGPVALCDKTTAHIFAESGSSVEAFDVTSLPRKTPSQASAAYLEEIDPSQGAYCVFTSGSTGKPKGVYMPHSALYNTVHVRPVVKSDDVCLQFCRITFDVHVGDIFCPLSCGATLVLIKEEMVLDFESVAKTLENMKVTTTQMVPSYAMKLFGFIERQPSHRRVDLSRMRNMVTSGEKLTWDLVAQFQRVLPSSCNIINLYGPAEACVDATIYVVPKPLRDDDPNRMLPSCPIGKPLPNYTTYVLDPERRPVPVGWEGELYIGGHGLFSEYLNQPEITEKALVRVSLSEEVAGDNPKNPILYKTGDVVRQLPDGNMVFVGRADFQVKIRGQRVELGEIEHVILKEPGVKDCVVTVVAAGASKDVQVVCYCVPEEMSASTKSSSPELIDLSPELLAAMEGRCKKTLPAHMQPAIYVGMSSLPLNQNMKVDRKKLPQPNVASKPSAPKSSNVKAIAGQLGKVQTATQKSLATVWASVLEKDAKSIGPSDDFFVLGGSSLSAAEVVGQIRSSDICTEFTVIDVFENTTLSAMAGRIDEILGIESEAPAEAVEVGKYQTTTQKALAMVWADVLEKDVDSIEVPDDFFVLGGSSLSAAEIVGQIRSNDICSEFTVIDVFENTTLKEMAARIDEILGIDSTIATETTTTTAKSTAPVKKVRDMVVPLEVDRTPTGTPLCPRTRILIQFVWWLFLSLGLGVLFLPTITFMRMTINEYGAESVADFVRVFVVILLSSPVYGAGLVLFTLAVKWIVIGKIKPGVYRQWSPYMLRWWMQNNLVNVTNKFVGFFLQDTALYPWYLRLMGAKIGRNCILDSTKFFDLDLITLGDEVVIEALCSIHAHTFDVIDGEVVFVLGPVTIGDGTVFGIKVAVEPDTMVGDNVELQSGCTVVRGASLAPCKTYANAPIELMGDVDVDEMKARHGTRRAVNYSITTTAFQILGMFLYMSLWVGGIALGLWPANEIYKSNRIVGLCFMLSITPVIMLTFFNHAIPVLKWIILGKVIEGRYPITPELLARHWIMGRLMSTMAWTFPSLGTPATNNMTYWTMGLTYGAQCQGTYANFSAAMDLVNMGDRVWLGASCVVIPWYFEGYEMVFKEVNFKDGAVLSPQCIALAGSTVHSGGVMGPSSVLGPNDEVPQGVVYMNRAPKLKTGGEYAGLDPNEAFGYWVFQVALFFHTSLTYGILGVSAIPMAYFFDRIVIDRTNIDDWELTQHAGHWELVPMQYWGVIFIPILVTSVLFVYTIVCSQVVRFIKHRENNSTTFFDYRFLLFLWEGHMLSFSLLSPLHSNHLMLKGTELGPFLCRVYGGKVGQNVYWDSYSPSEFDMFEAGTNTVMEGCDVVHHTVMGVRTSHVFNQDPIKFGNNCVLRPGSYALPPVRMGDYCVLGTNAIIMKGEGLNDHAVASGNPARVYHDKAAAAVLKKATMSV